LHRLGTEKDRELDELAETVKFKVPDLEVSGLATNYRHKVIKKLELNDPNKERLERIRANQPISRGFLPTSKLGTERPHTSKEPPLSDPKLPIDPKTKALQLYGKLNEVKQLSDYEGVKRGDL
jgi:hypothetical protein